MTKIAEMLGEGQMKAECLKLLYSVISNKFYFTSIDCANLKKYTINPEKTMREQNKIKW